MNAQLELPLELAPEQDVSEEGTPLPTLVISADTTPEGLAIEADDDPEIVNFWDCLQRPALEHCANVSLREIVRQIGRESQRSD